MRSALATMVRGVAARCRSLAAAPGVVCSGVAGPPRLPTAAAGVTASVACYSSSAVRAAADAVAAGAGAAPAAKPFIVTEADMGDDDVGKRAVRRGWFVLRGIRGHTKKLSPLARQVRPCCCVCCVD